MARSCAIHASLSLPSWTLSLFHVSPWPPILLPLHLSLCQCALLSSVLQLCLGFHTLMFWWYFLVLLHL